MKDALKTVDIFVHLGNKYSKKWYNSIFQLL